MLQASYRLLLLLGLSQWKFQLDKVHKELEPLKDTIEKLFWEACGRFPVWLVAGAEAGAGMQPGLPSINITWDFFHKCRDTWDVSL